MRRATGAPMSQRTPSRSRPHNTPTRLSTGCDRNSLADVSAPLRAFTATQAEHLTAVALQESLDGSQTILDDPSAPVSPQPRAGSASGHPTEVVGRPVGNGPRRPDGVGFRSRPWLLGPFRALVRRGRLRRPAAPRGLGARP